MIRGLLIAGAAIWLATAGAIGAMAEERPETLLDASPAAGAVVARPPNELSLTFAAPVQSVRIRVFKDGVPATDADAQIEGTLAVTPAPSEGSGSYLVDWKGMDTADNPLAGAYVFTVDPRGTGSVAVQREIAGAGGALGGLRVFAAAVAAGGAIGLLVGTHRVRSHREPREYEHLIGAAAAATAVGGLMAAMTYGLPADASPGDLIDSGVVLSAASSVPGRAWMSATLTVGTLPFVLVLLRTVRSRWGSVAVLVVSAGAVMWVSIGLGWLVREPWPLVVAVIAMGALVWIGVVSGRPVAALVGLLVALAIAVPVVVDLRSSGTSGTAQTGDLLIEMSADPAESGPNEMHLYGFDTTGGAADLGPTTVVAFHRVADVGPLEVPLLRAGPNHLLSYHADLPLAGAWTFRIRTTMGNATPETATMEMNFR
jgi:methionine-rich copper-binding protein CopC